MTEAAEASQTVAASVLRGTLEVDHPGAVLQTRTYDIVETIVEALVTFADGSQVEWHISNGRRWMDGKKDD